MLTIFIGLSLLDLVYSGMPSVWTCLRKYPTMTSMATPNESKRTADEWSEWLLRRRHGGSEAYLEEIKSGVAGYAEKVLEGAQLGSGMVLLDVGSGEGLVPFRAIERVGRDLQV